MKNHSTADNLCWTCLGAVRKGVRTPHTLHVVYIGHTNTWRRYWNTETIQTLFRQQWCVWSVHSPELCPLQKRSRSPYHKFHQDYSPPTVLVPLPPCVFLPINTPQCWGRGCPGAQLVSETGQSSTLGQVRHPRLHLTESQTPSGMEILWHP